MRIHFSILTALVFLTCSCLAAAAPDLQGGKKLSPHMIIVQPIILQGDDGSAPASMALPEGLVDRAYEKAGIDFYFLQPIRYNNSAARDGKINLDKIVIQSTRDGILRGQGDIVNMFFVNAVDGHKGPLGRGMFNGNITFIALGEKGDQENLKAMQAFVIAHEVGHNLGLPHAVDDPLVPDDLPNIQGDGAFEDRIDPRHSLTTSQIEKIMKSPLVRPRIDILSLEDGKKAILDETFEPYFSKLQKREIEAFTGGKAPEGSLEEVRAYAKDRFQAAVLDFSSEEKDMLAQITRNVTDVLLANDFTVMAHHPWRFIKIDSWLCGGFAHTRGTFIILSQRHLDFLRDNWKADMDAATKRKILVGFGALLVHEQLHSLQRSFPDKFARLSSNYWHFKNAQIIPEDSITLNQVSNPDAPQANWLIPDPSQENRYHWIRTLLKPTEDIPQMGKDFTDQVFTVVQKDGTYRVQKDTSGQPVGFPVSEFTSFKDSFPVTRGIDHPNEISAYMFSDIFKATQDKSVKAFEKVPASARKNSDQFIQWVNCEMSLNNKKNCENTFAE